MSCEHLVCASCLGPVAEGRCPVCRVARADLHPHAHVSNALLAALAVLLLALAVLLAMLTGVPAGAHSPA